MNQGRVLVEYKVVSGIGQIIIGVDIECLLLSRYCMIQDSYILDPVFGYLVISASQVQGLLD